MLVAEVVMPSVVLVVGLVTAEQGGSGIISSGDMYVTGMVVTTDAEVVVVIVALAVGLTVLVILAVEEALLVVAVEKAVMGVAATVREARQKEPGREQD